MKLSIQPLRKAAKATLNWIYPPFCTLCHADTKPGEHLCDECRQKATKISAPFCQVCSEPFPGQIEGEFVCPNCQDRHFHFDCAVAPYRSRGPVREVIHQFKYDYKLHLRHVLAGWLAESLADPRLQPRIDRIIPVPLHPARQRERGFNQARVLAVLLSRRSGIPLCDDLKRIRFTTTQTRFDRKTRMENLRNAFRLRNTEQVRNLHLLLIDDVLTTGSTVDECARVLMEAGAATVRVAAVARG
jgi:ComF family protein